MAVTRIWKVTGNLANPIDYAANPEKTRNPTYSKDELQALKDVMSYAVNEEKTEKQFYVTGVNCDPVTARDQFMTAKQAFGKEDGIAAYHGYQSFAPGEITPELAHRIGIEFAKEVWGEDYQVLVATHLNTHCLHNHFVVNSISFRHGRRLQKTQWFKLSKVSDRICEKYRLSVVKESQGKHLPYALAKAEQEGRATRLNMAKEAVDVAIRHSCSMAEFQQALKSMGYDYQFSPKRKYWMVRQKNWGKPIRLYWLGEEYTNERIVERVKANPLSVRMERFQKEHRKREPTMLDKLLWKNSLKNLYLYYCYKLGYLPEHIRNPPSAKVPYLLRDDLIKLKNISEEAELLSRENIETVKELLLYQNSVEEKVADLMDKRKMFRNEKSRKATTDERKSELEREITSVNEQLKKLRKEVQRCERIKDRSLELSQKLKELEELEKEKREERTER